MRQVERCRAGETETDRRRQTDGQPERGTGAGRAEAEAWPGPPSSALAAPDAGANVLGD